MSEFQANFQESTRKEALWIALERAKQTGSIISTDDLIEAATKLVAFIEEHN